MKKLLFPIFYIILILAPMILPVNASTLNLTVTTSKQTYNRYDEVQISGLLTLDNLTFSSGLVAIHVVDSRDNNYVIRTVNTGQNPMENLLAEVVSCYLSDASGNPLSSAENGKLAYFTITVSNYDTAPRTILTTINVYDNKNMVLDVSAFNKQFAGRETFSFTISVAIPSAAASGKATAFVNVYTTWPKNGGYALSPEKAFHFDIITSGGTPPTTPSGNQGTYTLKYRLQKRATLGTHSVYVTSQSYGLTASNTNSFSVVQPGDMDNDGDLDAVDTSAYVKAYIAYWSQQPWNRLADIDNDGDVDSTDTAAYVRAYMIYWSGN